MIDRTPPTLWELWLIYRHTDHVQDLAAYIEAGGDLTDEARKEILRWFSKIENVKRHPYKNLSIIDEIEWLLDMSDNRHIKFGTKKKSLSSIYKKIAEENGMTVSAVKKIWQRRKEPEEPNDIPF
jgi:hypothetical protein